MTFGAIDGVDDTRDIQLGGGLAIPFASGYFDTTSFGYKEK